MIQTLQLQTFQVQIGQQKIMKLVMTQEVKTDFANINMLTSLIVLTRVLNRIFFHFPVSECHNRVDNRIANITKIIG